jgi:hypothetical protein
VGVNLVATLGEFYSLKCQRKQRPSPSYRSCADREANGGGGAVFGDFSQRMKARRNEIYYRFNRGIYALADQNESENGDQ